MAVDLFHSCLAVVVDNSLADRAEYSIADSADNFVADLTDRLAVGLSDCRLDSFADWERSWVVGDSIHCCCLTFYCGV